MANKFVSHADKVMKRVNSQMLKNLKSASIYVTRAAKANVKPGGASGFKTGRGSAGLLGSIGYEVDRPRYRSRIGTNLKYARIHEQGGTITPKSAKVLAVPVSPEAKKASGPRSFSDLVFIPRAGKPPLLARIRAGGPKRARAATMDVMYVLLKSVAIPPRPYLRPALTRNRAKVTELLLKPIPPRGK